jgi:hypothetical protein
MERKVWILIGLAASFIIGFIISAIVAVIWEEYAHITIECFTTKFWICYIPTSLILFIVFLFFTRRLLKNKTIYQNDIIDDIIQSNK